MAGSEGVMSDLNGVIGLGSQWGRIDAAGISGSPKRDAVARLFLDKWTADLFDEKREPFHRVDSISHQKAVGRVTSARSHRLVSCDTPKINRIWRSASEYGETESLTRSTHVQVKGGTCRICLEANVLRYHPVSDHQSPPLCPAWRNIHTALSVKWD